MKVNRRKFLKLFGAAPVAAAVPSLVTAAVKAKPAFIKPDHHAGFGLAQIKPEGGTRNYDSFAKELWPGINKWYGEAYKTADLRKYYD